jgi:hypothetical protein
MGLLSRARWTLVLVGIGLLLCAALGGVLWRARHRRITDRELLLEAVEEWRLAGSPFPGPNSQILEQQAAQGYYDDAITTARLWKLDSEQHWLFVEVTKIRAENGDIAGAKNMIEQLAALDAKTLNKAWICDAMHRGGLPCCKRSGAICRGRSKPPPGGWTPTRC